MTSHVQFAFHPIVTPTLRTLMIDWKRKNNRIIPESALVWVVHPISFPVGLLRNAFLQPVILPTTMRTSTIPTHKRISWMNHHQFAFHLIVIPPTSPGTNTNLSLWERTKIDHLQFAFHYIVIPIPRIMKMMKVISRKTQYLPSKQTRRGSTNISAHIPSLLRCKNTLLDRTKRKTMGMMISQFVCHLFVYLLLNRLLFSFLVMRSLYIAHNYTIMHLFTCTNTHYTSVHRYDVG
jgi:hypothetical protein